LSAETSNGYEKEWKRFQVLIRLLLVAVILLVLLYSFIMAIGEKLLPNIFFVCVVLVWALLVVLNLFVIFWRCPRCKGFYFRWIRMNLLYLPDCKNCGLGYYEGSSIVPLGERFGF